MSSQTDSAAGNTIGSDDTGTLASDIINADVKGATLNIDKSTLPSEGPEKDAGKDYIGSFPNNSGMGAAGVRDITTPDEANARAAQLGGDPDVADTES